jgi:glucokinase
VTDTAKQARHDTKGLPSAAATATVDLGTTHIRTAMVDAAGTIIGSVRRPLPSDRQARRRAPAELVAQLITRPPLPPGWSHRACRRRDCHQRRPDLAANPGLDGIGGGIIVNGRLNTRTGHGGEIGHLLIDPQGPPCRCGHRESWEQMADGLALNSAAHKAARGRPCALIAIPAADGQSSAASLAQAAAAGDPVTGEHHTCLFARSLDSPCTVLGPHVVSWSAASSPAPGRSAYLAAAGALS